LAKPINLNQPTHPLIISGIGIPLVRSLINIAFPQIKRYTFFNCYDLGENTGSDEFILRLGNKFDAIVVSNQWFILFLCTINPLLI